MIESGVRQLQGNGINLENVLDWCSGVAIRAGTVAHPEQVACAIPNTIAGAFEHQIARQLGNHVDETARVERSKCAVERLLLAAALWTAEARQNRLAIEDDCSIGREHQIRQMRRRRNQLDRHAKTGERTVERCPFPPRGIDQNAAFARPTLRVHPRIDGVVDSEMVGPAHQKARSRCRHWSGLLMLCVQAATSGARCRSKSTMTSAKRSRATSRSSRAITSGGASRTTVSCVSFDSTPFASKASQARRAVAKRGSISAPAHRPRPRTSFNTGLLMARSRSSIWSPSTRLRSTSPSSAMT